MEKWKKRHQQQSVPKWIQNKIKRNKFARNKVTYFYVLNLNVIFLVTIQNLFPKRKQTIFFSVVFHMHKNPLLFLSEAHDTSTATDTHRSFNNLNIFEITKFLFAYNYLKSSYFQCIFADHR